MKYLQDLTAELCFQYMNNEITEKEVIEICRDTGIKVKDIIICA